MATAGGASTFLPLGGPLLGLVLPALIHLCFCLHHFPRAVGRIFLDVTHRATPVCYCLYSLPALELWAFLGFDPQSLVFPTCSHGHSIDPSGPVGCGDLTGQV